MKHIILIIKNWSFLSQNLWLQSVTRHTNIIFTKFWTDFRSDGWEIIQCTRKRQRCPGQENNIYLTEAQLPAIHSLFAPALIIFSGFLLKPHFEPEEREGQCESKLSCPRTQWYWCSGSRNPDWSPVRYPLSHYVYFTSLYMFTLVIFKCIWV